MKVRMVSAGIYEELAIVSCFFLVGIFLAASYDILRMFRAFVPHGMFWINLEDFIYWMYVATVVFLILYEKNNGRSRGYIFGGLLVGAVLYLWSFSRICMPRILRFLQRLHEFLVRPLRKCGALLQKKRTKGMEICGKLWLCQKKRLKKLWKIVKMCLHKR
ncbi:MAG: spore cortex biosynthesis protein YabQ [Eubacterium sp.]|nr:spore cortex biosynthesis protein YabQ [Eubacterium sp.]